MPDPIGRSGERLSGTEPFGWVPSFNLISLPTPEDGGYIGDVFRRMNRTGRHSQSGRTPGDGGIPDRRDQKSLVPQMIGKANRRGLIPDANR